MLAWQCILLALSETAYSLFRDETRINQLLLTFTYYAFCMIFTVIFSSLFKSFTIPPTAAQVHVTANPLDSASTTIPAGRTTIVVQQPSLSLDYGGCSTILLREGEERLDRRKSRICSDQIQQLLDVTSQFTSEDLHEFDKRYDFY